MCARFLTKIFKKKTRQITACNNLTLPCKYGTWDLIRYNLTNFLMCARFLTKFSKKNRQIATCNILTLQLQVLDLGFNLIRVIPTTAFKETKDLTLLALDGNPMAFIPEEAISHLNKSLRGLSLGGRFLTCDCKMRWITEWIQNFDLQVTSRERNPQFCGNPQHLRDRNFYQLNTRGTYLCYLLMGIVTNYGRMIAKCQYF